MTAFKLFSFSAGELAPALHARSDQARYVAGLRTCKNMITLKSGGVTNRPGTEYLGPVKTASFNTRLVPFIFDDTDALVIEVGQYYFRWWQDGALVRFSPTDWSSLTTYTGGEVVSYAGDNYVARATFGTFVSVGSVNLNITPGTNGSAWYPLTSDIYEDGGGMQHNYPLLQSQSYVQSGDVVTFVPAVFTMAAMEVTRYSDRWTITAVQFTPEVSHPQHIAISGSVGSKTLTYSVTSVSDSGSESLPGLADVVPAGSSGTTIISAISAGVTTNPIITTSTSHGYSTGDKVKITGVVQTGGAAPYADIINGRTYVIDVLSATTFRLRNLTGYYSGLYTANSGRASKVGATGSTLADPGSSTPITVTWNAVANAREYNVYRDKNGIAGFVGTSRSLSFIDDGITPDTTLTPPLDGELFSSATDRPNTVSYVQQRMVFANTTDEPEKVWCSAVGDFHNFTGRFPSQADDPFSFAINGRSVSSVRHVLELTGKMIVLTAGGIWSVEGDASGSITPDSINARQQGFTGASFLRPLVIGNTVLYFGARAPYLYELRFDLSTGYPTRDLSVFSSHLFDGHYTLDSSYQESPYSVAWAVRDDGVLLGMTYVPEQDINGWHRHNTGEDEGDSFESVCVIPEDGDDSVYVVVRRTVNDATVRYVERFSSRAITTIEDDAWFVDSGLHYDGTNTTVTTMHLSGGTLWDTSETLTLTASAASFSAGTIAIGDAVVITDGTDTVRATVLAITSTTVAVVRPEGAVPAGLRTATATWSWARCLVPVAHLIGRTVAILADGSEQEQQTVDVSGNATLGRPAVKITVGLPYVSEIETLDPETPQIVLTGKRKRVTNVVLQVQESRGFEVGTDENHLFPWRQAIGNVDTIDLYTGPVDVPVAGDYENTGRVIVRQTSPLPLTVLAIIPNLEVGG